MIDILNELLLLSNALQSRNLDLPPAEKLITKPMKEMKGPYENKIEETVASDDFFLY